MTTAQREKTKAKLITEVERLEKAYGHKTGSLASAVYQQNVIPTGILSLDYALGTGGWPLGDMVEVYGPPDIGKSAAIGFNAIKSAQREGKYCGIIAVEPNFDKEWAAKHGVDNEMVVVARPDTGEDAFNILHEWVRGDLLDLIVFDSLGALLRASETETPGMGGQAGLITWGVKNTAIPAWKNNKSVIFLNQVRDVMNAKVPLLDSPGGWAAKHGATIRVQLKPGKERYTERIDETNVIVGRELIAVVTRNKRSEGTNMRAVFDFYQKETKTHPVGVDYAVDVLNTAVKTGVIQKSGGHYKHSLFGEKSIHGLPKIREEFARKPEIIDSLREEVLEAMAKDRGQPEIGPQIFEMDESNNGEGNQ